MTDYTPTTEEIKEGYVYGEYSDATGSPDADAEFDRWLAEVKTDAYDKAIRALFIGPAELLEIRAEAWAEGVADRDRYDYPENPYRQEGAANNE